MVSMWPELMVVNYSQDGNKAVQLIQQLVVTSKEDKACSYKGSRCEYNIR